jgi:hypothetical protein
MVDEYLNGCNLAIKTLLCSFNLEPDKSPTKQPSKSRFVVKKMATALCRAQRTAPVFYNCFCYLSQVLVE